jgi:hypothetical protein
MRDTRKGERNMKHYGVLFTRKTGKIVKTLEHDHTDAFLKMYAMGNVSPSRDYVVFNEEGTIEGYYEGKKDDMPTICRDMEGKHIDEIAKGLLEALK